MSSVYDDFQGFHWFTHLIRLRCTKISLSIFVFSYSSLDDDAKFKLMLKWVEKWDEFTDAAPALFTENTLQQNSATEPDPQTSTGSSTSTTTSVEQEAV